MTQINNSNKSGGRSYASQSSGRKSSGGTSRSTSSSRSRSSSRSSGTSRSRASGSRSSYQPRKNYSRKKGPQFDITKILLGIIIAAVAVICIMAAVKFAGGRSKEVETDVTTESTATEAPETELEKQVTVDGISITGMSREQAREALKKKYKWSMKATYNGEEYELQDMMGTKIDALLEEIYRGTPKESYKLDTSGLEEVVQSEVDQIAAKWNVAAKNGSISGFDKQNGSFTYAGEQNGFAVDKEKLASDIAKSLAAKDFQAVIEVSGNVVAPEISEARAKELYQVIGTYSTKTTANKDRNRNVELAAEALNGLIIQPGEEFSFNNATGERSLAKGYKPAGAYVNGVLVEEPGGGVCQVSSTLYNAVVFSGLTTTQRHAHSYEPSYVTPGEDAMVSYGGPDMKFVNKSASAIAIRASFADRTLKISIVGIPILEKGVTLSMSSKKIAEVDAPAPVYEEDQTLQLDEEKIVKAETKGSRWVTNLVTKKDGVVISDEFFHNSSYRGKPATIKRNTSGVVVTEPGESLPEEGIVPPIEGTDGIGPVGPSEPGTTQPTTGSGAGPGEQPTTAPSKPAETTPPSTTAPIDQGGPGGAAEPGIDGGESFIPPSPLS